MKRITKNGSTAKVDIRDVAARANVSIATVSRTINYVPTVDPELAARVWKAVEELNYFPNTQARALVSGKSKLLGLIISEITNPFFPELIHEFELAANAHGYEIVIGSTNHQPATMVVCARRMLERKVDGVAILTFAVEEFMLNRFVEERVPVVFVEAASRTPAANAISVDYQAGIHEAVEHLVQLGHRKIAFISGPLDLRSALARQQAFLESLQHAGLTANPKWLIEGTHTLDGGRDSMQQLLAQKSLPTAIMCSNDMTAIGVQHAVYEAGLKVPEDFSLIGFDNIHLAEYTIPPLTTVRMSCFDLALAAVNSLVNQISPSAPTDKAHALINTRLILRRTTAPPSKPAS